MTTPERNWILTTTAEAIEAKHIYSRMAACEAALESAYGQSALARQGNNLFGMKIHKHPDYGVLVLPTKEFLDGLWVTTTAEWVKYDTIAECFEDRMETLLRLRTIYPHYMAALTAPDAESYVREVSKTWSTDPARADKCIAIFGEAFPQGPLTNNSEAVRNAVIGEN